MEYSQTAEIRIDAKQADRLFKRASLECIIDAIGATLLLAAVWILDLSTVAAMLCGAPLLIAIVRWMIAILYNRASPPNAEISRWQLFFNIGALANALFWGAAAVYLIHVDNLIAAGLAIGVAVIMSLGTVVL